MIDIHAHVLPQVDDGPSDWEESLIMLRKGEEDGIRGVVCTSHVLDRLNESVEREFSQKFEELKRRADEKAIKMSLWLGSELHIHADFDVNSPVATLNGNRKYMLIELPMADIPKDAGEKLFKYRMAGFIPILAHPERNAKIIRNPQAAFDFVQRGVLLQINAGSVLGYFGKRVKRTASMMIDQQWGHFVASDCHTPGSRSMVLSRAYKAVERGWDHETAEALFRINPYKAVIGEDISVPPPKKPEEKGRKSKLSNLLNVKKGR